ncbi:MAG: hypothetical protein IPI49_25130 [Myxococcales bacterium]|nr:hypothetical protein [Myxococcales bacterium]
MSWPSGAWRRGPGARLLVAATALAGGLAACETRAKGDYFEGLFRDDLTKRYGPTTRFECPESILLQTQDTQFECELSVEDQRRMVTVVLLRNGTIRLD